MSLSIFEASVPVFLRAFDNFSAILEKGETFAQVKGIDPGTLVEARLAPDMLSLAGQVQRASDTAKFCAARLTATEGPSFEDNEASFAELHQRIAKTVAYLKGFDASKFEGAENRQIVLKRRQGEVTLDGRGYLFTFALPNFFFHVTTGYDVLRHKGVPVGKSDFLGPL
ncbi:DUF1993 domain-containing protein [Ancylobacter defluvii]|uniref:DUF1993 domain-containing protein n=1 Tax=Ancylobacter defluvii TaxID=1282440 RepID=A0A9W6JWZ9_9HYPH|nr:DUF1993 domain-containing protein [Ancylobacter defluvii]MBS7588762.1 DUF1993 domain-containing protein [Ancylobacter defluvii]GLK84048.1 hypothetical protein GCM10017653_21180 [Ancylobacter defluvii]